MYVGNCTDEDADYVIDDGGGPGKSCSQGTWKKDIDVEPTSKVEFTGKTSKIKKSIILKNMSNVLVLFHYNKQGDLDVSSMKLI